MFRRRWNRPSLRPLFVVTIAVVFWTGIDVASRTTPNCAAAELTVTVTGAPDGLTVGVIRRWDSDGNPVRPVNPKARIESPELTAVGRRHGSDQWEFEKLAPGRYDLVLMTKNRIRLEGFTFVPVLEFDPWLASDSRPASEAWEQVRTAIAASKHYENKVTPLFNAGNDKQIRVLMQLVRDEATSYDAEFGQPVATIRHEIWQFTNQYGGWVKEKRTRVFDRALLGKAELQQWTWVWDPKLGGIEVENRPVKFSCEWPKKLASNK